MIAFAFLFFHFVSFELSIFESLCSQLRKEGAKDTLAVQCDVSDSDSITECMEHVRMDMGSVTCLINNAGIGGDPTFAIDRAEESWRNVIDINLTAPWLFSQKAAEQMRDRSDGVKGGSIINISSVLGERVMKTLPDYCAAKAVCIKFTMFSHLWLPHTALFLV